MMLSRLVFKLGAFGVVILVIGAALALWMGARTPAHLLAFTLAVQSDGNDYIYVTHLERALAIRATPLPSNDFILRISPDGEWLLYLPAIEPANRFGLVNLRTWESRLLPEVPERAMQYAAQWDLENQQIRLTGYGNNGIATHYHYDILTNEINPVEAPSFLPSALRDLVIVGSIVGMNEHGEATYVVTLDDENIPRIFDYEPDMRLTRFEIGRDLPAVSIAPAYDFLVTPITRHQQVDLFIVPAEEGEILQITDDALEERSVSWSPDGRYVSYTVEIVRLLQGGVYTEIRVYDVKARKVAYTLSFERDRIMYTMPAWVP